MTTTVGRRERKKAQTRQALTDAALRLFLEHGYDAVTVAQIAEAADVSIATVFKHVPDGKEALIFDDGRFTYMRFPNNREVPAVFHVLGDGSETLVNARMEGDLLVVDRVSRRLMLRAGSAVVGVWNEAFDPDGVPPELGTTVSGVQRELKPSPAAESHSAPGAKP